MYYLPINISERRIHICELSDEEKAPVFGFLFTGDTLFQTSPHGGNELIAYHGDNIDLEDYHFEARREDDIDGKKVYGFFIVKDSDDNGDEDGEDRFNLDGAHKISDDVPFAIDANNKSFRTTGVKVLFKLKGSRRIVDDDFIIKIHFEANGGDFCYAFKGYPAISGEHGNITDAAIDFGSEASQIKVGTSRMNINQVFYEKFYKDKSWHRVKGQNINVDTELWQSDKNHDLYRSVYFIHRNPGDTNFADKPNKSGETTYVQALMPLTVDKEYYEDLLLLPNLKLMDIMEDSSNVMSAPINVPTGSDLLKQTNTSNLSDHNFRQNTLRLILSDLMHCVIANTNANSSNGKRYLRLVMLMPNVYDQKKVYSIVEALYRDFDTIVSNRDGHKFDGMEVAVISESDASFLGALQSHTDMITSVPDAPHQYYLIVDAGKGTTDFSIMRASDGNICVWNSLYRGGLPASGHAMTYAIYEAVWAFFKRRKGLDIDDLLRKNADRATVRRFMNHLETLKANYSTYKQQPDSRIQLSATCNDLSDVNQNIEEYIIGHGYLVAGTHEIMKEKVAEMSRLVVKSIKGYMTSAHKGRKFGRVLLTGRAFMLKEFQDALVGELAKEGLADTDCIKTLNGDELKKICLDGSTAIGSKFFINNNSELICRPTVINHWSKNPFSLLLRLIGKLGKLLNGTVSDDMFYYDGIEVENSKNTQITMGLGSSWINNAEHIYYVGRGLLVKRTNGNNDIDELTPQKVDDIDDSRMIAQLTKESLFPYYPSSICAPNTHKVLYKAPGSTSPAATPVGDTTESTPIVQPQTTTSSDDKLNFDNL